MLFAGNWYYPQGGTDDLVDVFRTIEVAMDAIGFQDDWAHIYDIQTFKVVKFWSRDTKVWVDSEVL